MTLISARGSARRLSDGLIDRAPLANIFIFGGFAWWAAWHLPLPRWWATR